VRLVVDADHIALGIDTAIPCGLIINELVSNALKHAFPDGRSGVIRVSLHPTADGRYRMVVADDGVGLPVAIDPRKTTTLGLQLVMTLTDQLNGELEAKRGHGTEFIITFSEAKARQQIE